MLDKNILLFNPVNDLNEIQEITINHEKTTLNYIKNIKEITRGSYKLDIDGVGYKFTINKTKLVKTNKIKSKYPKENVSNDYLNKRKCYLNLKCIDYHFERLW